MLDIGFPELLLVTLVILLVFGPERLPEVLRTLGGWIGQARRSFSSLKNEIEREIGADEIRRDLHNARILEEAEKVRKDIERAGADLRASEAEIDALTRRRMAALDAEQQAAEGVLPDTDQARQEDRAANRTPAADDDAGETEPQPTGKDESAAGSSEPEAPAAGDRRP